MALLDLQSMEQPEELNARPNNSGASKNCNNHSGLSLLLCP
jgi:hypothetical protein